MQRAQRPGPGAFDPPSQDARPWYPLVLVIRGVTVAAGQYVYTTIKQIHSAVTETLGIQVPATSESAIFEYRFHWAQVWMYPSASAAGAASNNVGVVFYALQSGDAASSIGIRAVKEDVGTPVRPATVYHKWNKVDQATIFGSDKDRYLLAVDSAASGLSLVYQISLVWRSAAGDIVPGLRTGTLFQHGLPRQLQDVGSSRMGTPNPPATEAGSSSSATTGWEAL